LSPGLNWRAFYTILLVPAVIVYMCLRAEMLPESPRYLYLVGRREEGYNTLLDMYEAEQVPLPWPAESIAVTCAPDSKAAASESTQSLQMFYKAPLTSSTSVAAWLAAAMFLTSAASQCMRIWMPVLFLNHLNSEPHHNAISELLGLGTHTHYSSNHSYFSLPSNHSQHLLSNHTQQQFSNHTQQHLLSSSLLQQSMRVLPANSNTGGAVLSLLRIVPGEVMQSDPSRYIVMLLSQAYIVQALGVVLCAYGACWIRRKRMVQWSLPAAAIFTMATLGVALNGNPVFCGPLLGLQLAAQSCGLNFLQVFAIEHFPTSQRASVVAMVIFAAQLGDVLTPTLGSFVVQRVSRASAVVFFAALYLLAWFVTLRLPLPTTRERSLHDVDEPRQTKEVYARARKRERTSYQSI